MCGCCPDSCYNGCALLCSRCIATRLLARLPLLWCLPTSLHKPSIFWEPSALLTSLPFQGAWHPHPLRPTRCSNRHPQPASPAPIDPQCKSISATPKVLPNLPQLCLGFLDCDRLFGFWQGHNHGQLLVDGFTLIPDLVIELVLIFVALPFEHDPSVCSFFITCSIVFSCTAVISLSLSSFFIFTSITLTLQTSGADAAVDGPASVAISETLRV